MQLGAKSRALRRLARTVKRHCAGRRLVDDNVGVTLPLKRRISVMLECVIFPRKRETVSRSLAPASLSLSLVMRARLFESACYANAEKRERERTDEWTEPS